MKISVILPAYNEAASILRLIADIHVELAGYEHEIILVDDNSPDGTYGVVTEARLPYVHAVLRREDRGLANSIRCGLEHATGEIVVVMDSDFNHQPKYLPFMVQALASYDCVSASRFVYGGAMYPRTRHIVSWLFNVFVRVMTKGEITDNLYGFFAIRREALQQVDYSLVFWGYGDYFMRLLYYLQKARITILQFPAVNGRRLSGRGNSAFLRVFLQYTRETLKLALKS